MIFSSDFHFILHFLHLFFKEKLRKKRAFSDSLSMLNMAMFFIYGLGPRLLLG